MDNDQFPQFQVFDGYRFEGSPSAQAKLVARLSATKSIQTFVNASVVLKPTECVSRLFEAGLVGVDGNRAKGMLVEAIGSRKTVRKFIATRNGWHDRDYVQLGQCLHKAGERSVWSVRRLPRSTGRSSLTRDVRLTKLLKKVAPLSSYLSFAIMVAFAGAVLEIVGERDGIIFYFSGDSSTGKTTLISVIQALTQPIDRRELAPFEFTPSGLEDLAYAANDSVFCIDEVRTVAEADVVKIMRQFVYRVVNGGGKRRSRSASVQEQYPELNWRVICALTGELNLAKVLQAEKSGIDARFLQIDIPPRNKGGVFDGRLNIDKNASDVAELQRACERYNGKAYSKWLKFLVALTDTERDTYRSRLEYLTRQIVHPIADSLEIRRARKFAIVALTGEMLKDAGVFDWVDKEPMKLVTRIFRSTKVADRARHSELEMTRWLGHLLMESFNILPAVNAGGTTVVTKGSRQLIQIRKDHLISATGHLDRKGLLDWLDRNACIYRPSKARTSVYAQSRKGGDSTPVLYLDVQKSTRLFSMHPNTKNH